VLVAGQNLATQQTHVVVAIESVDSD